MDTIGKPELSHPRAAFEDYLRRGGFPEVVLAAPAMRPEGSLLL